MPLRGLRDIKTHGTLSREGRLVSVARDLHKLGGRCSEIGDAANSSDWSVERHIFRKGRSAKTTSSSFASLYREFNLEKKVRLCQIEAIQGLLEEFRQAIIERIPVSMQEFERLQKRLSELQTE